MVKIYKSAISSNIPNNSATACVPGKINLYLSVEYSLENTYHNLTTIFHSVSLLDKVIVSRSDVFSLKMIGKNSYSVPLGRSNLAWRAAELISKKYIGILPTININIDKLLPVAGGMGGGSADAAAVLVAMNKLFNLKLTTYKMYSMAATLGSDVSFAIHGRTALGQRHGEKLTTVLVSKPLYWVLAFPYQELSTCKVFDILDKTISIINTKMIQIQSNKLTCLLTALLSGNPFKLAYFLENSLQLVSLRLCPVLHQIIQYGLEAGALVGIVSGSGPTCFFLCSSSQSALLVKLYLTQTKICKNVVLANGPVGGAHLI